MMIYEIQAIAQERECFSDLLLLAEPSRELVLHVCMKVSLCQL